MPEYQISDLTITVKFNAQLDSEKAVNENAPKYSYTAQVNYDNVKDAVEKAGKFTVWALARRARKGELPRDGRTITVNGEGEYQKSLRDQIAEMDDAKFTELFAEMQRRMQEKAAAEMVQGTPESDNTDSEMTEEELEQATAPVPAKNEGRKKTGRNK